MLIRLASHDSLQERFLSPRVVYWAHDQVFWQCSSLQACETHPCGSSADPITHLCFDVPDVGPIPTPAVKHQLLESWASVVEDYSKRRLSYPDIDKLPAIAGIVQAFAHVFKDEYIAGLFKRTLPRALTWSHAFPEAHVTRPEPREYRCPPWSWASTNNPVMVHIETSDQSDVAEVIGIDIKLEDPTNPFGRLRSAQLELRGWVVPFRWNPPDTVKRVSWGNLPVSAYVPGHDLVTKNMTFDYIDYLHEVEEDTYFTPIGIHSDGEEIKGLILRKVVSEGHNNVYMRVDVARVVAFRGRPYPGIVEHFEKLPKGTIVLV
jgi:hypothetical protein